MTDSLKTAGLARLVPQGSATGVDLSPDVCERARILHPSADHPNLYFKPYDILAEPDTGILPLAAFDVVFTSQTVIHLPDPIRAIRNMRTLLRPGGILAMRETDTVAWYPNLPGLELYNRALSGLIRASGGPGLGRARELQVWAAQAGFESERINCGAGGTVYSTPAEREWWAQGILGRFEEGFGQKMKAITIGWPADLGGGTLPVGEDGVARMRQDLEEWIRTPGGSYSAFQCEVICIK